MATRGTSDASPAQPSLRLRFDRFELDEAEARLTRDGEAVALAPKPFALLCALARTPQALVAKNALLDRVWGHRFVTDSVLKSAISELRAALRDDPKQPRYIETVSRRGYRFIAAVASPPAPSAACQLVAELVPGFHGTHLIGRLPESRPPMVSLRSGFREQPGQRSDSMKSRRLSSSAGSTTRAGM